MSLIVARVIGALLTPTFVVLSFPAPDRGWLAWLAPAAQRGRETQAKAQAAAKQAQAGFEARRVQIDQRAGELLQRLQQLGR